MALVCVALMRKVAVPRVERPLGAESPIIKGTKMPVWSELSSGERKSMAGAILTAACARERVWRASVTEPARGNGVSLASILNRVEPDASGVSQ